MNVTSRRIRRAAAAALVFSLFGLAQDAFAYSNNPAAITGRTSRDGSAGCASCHGASADGSLTLTISGPTALNAGQSATYTATATKVVANGTKMGLAIAASDPGTPLAVFAGESMSRVGSGELIHNAGLGALRTTTSNSASYQFTYTMPAAAGVGTTHTIHAVSALAFTGWNHATNFVVRTRPVVPTSVTPSNITPASVNLTWSGGGPEYRVVYKTGAVAPANETDGTATDLGAVTTTTVSGLTASTQYSFAVFSKLTGQTIYSSTAATTSATTTAVVAATRYVNVATGVNTGTCTSAGSPCRTITYAMGQAVQGNPGDLVQVAPGTYNLAAGEAFPIVMKSGTQLVSSGTAENTIIDAAGDSVQIGILSLSSNQSAAALIRGFTFKNGLYLAGQAGVSLGGGIRIVAATAKVTIDRNIFNANEARGYSADNTTGMTGGLGWGGALYVFSSPVDVTNNIFIGNIARGGNGYSHGGTPLTGNEYGGPGDGGAIYFGGSGKITNNTFYGNVAVGGNGGFSSTGTAHGGGGHNGAIAATGNPAPSIDNNIFFGNAANSGTGGTPDPSSAGALTAGNAPSISRNLFHVNSVNGGPSSGDSQGTGAVFGDPLFNNAPSNLRILPQSIAQAAGTATGAPSVDFDGVTRPNPPSIGAFEASAIVTVATTDFNDDGKSDLLWRNTSTGQVYRMLMNGFSRTSEALVYTEANTAWSIIADADFNGDGTSDLLWRNSSTGQVYLMPFNSSGLPSGGGFIYTEANAAWKIAFTPDLDGDGKADLLWWNSSTGQVYAMLWNGSAFTTQGFVYTEPNTAWRIEAVGDFSGTGKQNQLLWRNTSTGMVWFMTVTVTGGGFTQAGQLLYNSTPPYQIIAAADFNGDGKDDILWRQPSTGAIYLMLMNGAAITFEGQIYQEANTAWKVISTGDYNGDGKADILWRNDSTGQVYMMLMNGAAITSQAMVYQEPNTLWKILGPWEYRIP